MGATIEKQIVDRNHLPKFLLGQPTIGRHRERGKWPVIYLTELNNYENFNMEALVNIILHEGYYNLRRKYLKMHA